MTIIKIINRKHMVTFDYNSEEKIIKAVFTGRMDYMAVVKLNEIIPSEPLIMNMSSEDQIVFDIKEVDYVASSFIRICVLYAKKAGNGRFSMINCQPFIKKTFKISGLDEILNISWALFVQDLPKPVEIQSYIEE